MLRQISVRWQKLIIAMCGTVTMFIGLGTISPVPIVGTAVNQSSQVSPPKNQYILVNRSMSWSAANLYCEKRGAHLATITSAAENQAIVSLIASKGAKKEYWLGGVRGDDHWQWITGEEFSYTNWASGEPTDFGPDENRLSIIGTNNSAMPLGVWDDNFNRGYTGDFALRNFGLICEWANSSSVRYTIVDQSMPWTEAAAYCDEHGAHLATITSATENQAIISLIASKGTKKEYWLGGVRGDERWQWITGEEFSYTNWASGEPTNFGLDENRLSIISANNGSLPSGVWDDNFNRGYTGEFALSNFGLICEWAP